MSDVSVAAGALAKNFVVMPDPLKLITASVLGVLISVFTTMFPNTSAGVFGQFERHLTTTVWWGSGAGTIVLIVAGLFFASALMMLRRSPHGRSTYIAALLAMSASIPFVGGVMGMSLAEQTGSVIFNLVWTLIVSLYLHTNTAVRDYFGLATV
jgi:hypothetical protein